MSWRYLALAAFSLAALLLMASWAASERSAKEESMFGMQANQARTGSSGQAAGPPAPLDQAQPDRFETATFALG